jgi:hypothetical protein
MFIFDPDVNKCFVAIVIVNRVHKLELAKFNYAWKGKDPKLLK